MQGITTNAKSRVKKLSNGHISQKDDFVVSIASGFPHVRLCPNLLQFKDSSMQEGKEYLGVRTVKTFEYENTRSHVKKF